MREHGLRRQLDKLLELKPELGRETGGAAADGPYDADATAFRNIHLNVHLLATVLQQECLCDRVSRAASPHGSQQRGTRHLGPSGSKLPQSTGADPKRYLILHLNRFVGQFA